MIPKVRLIVAGCLFAGWIGYLAYLVSITPAIRCSCPGRNFWLPSFTCWPSFQVMPISIRTGRFAFSRSSGRRMRPAKNSPAPTSRSTICNSANRKTAGSASADILPLTRAPDGRYLLTEIPMSPGFHHDAKTHNYLRIYPATMEAGEQRFACGGLSR